MSQARKLRVLVVHDTEFDEENELEILGTEDLALLSLSLDDGCIARVISNWPDVVQLVGKLAAHADHGVSPEAPDILLVDCHFKDDKTSPQLPRLKPGIDPVDARGLLYGVVLAAYFLGAHPHQPFAFVPYSEDMTAAAGDAYAQTFYSLLSAMLDSVPGIIEADYYSKAMEATPASQTPAGVVASALRQYRSQLLQAFVTDYLTPIPETFEEVLTAVNTFLAGGPDLDPDLSLRWLNGKGKNECVLLSSLFADCRDGGLWIRDAAQRRTEMAWVSIREAGMQEFLRSVVDCRNYFKEVLEPTRDILEAIKRGSANYNWGRGQSAKQRRVLALAIVWALDRCETNYRGRRQYGDLKSLQKALHLDSTQINRSLGEVFGSSAANRGSEFVDALDRSDEWPFAEPAWLKSLVVRYLKGLYEKGRPSLAQKYWPKSLRG